MDREETKEVHQEEWDFYFSNVDDKPSSIAVDLGLSSVAPIRTQPNVMWVSIKMNNPRPDGLSSSDEYDTLSEIEERMTKLLASKYEASQVGRLTSNGYRDLYYYLGDTALYEQALSEIMLQFPSYEYDYGTKSDEAWGGYFDFLYPSPRQFQSIQNRRVIDNLEEQGDTLEKERPVDHWVYFKSEVDREAFLSEIKDENFNIVTKDYDNGLGELPFRLHISRVDKVDHNSVDEYTLHLWELAQEHNGDYDGWETSVETE
jgi:uncharacterized protein (TIGR01619 family)